MLPALHLARLIKAELRPANEPRSMSPDNRPCGPQEHRVRPRLLHRNSPRSTLGRAKRLKLLENFSVIRDALVLMRHANPSSAAARNNSRTSFLRGAFLDVIVLPVQLVEPIFNRRPLSVRLFG